MAEDEKRIEIKEPGYWARITHATHDCPLCGNVLVPKKGLLQGVYFRCSEGHHWNARDL